MKKVITICSSAAFYKHACELAEELEARGYKVLLPETAIEMRAKQDFEVSHYKIWYADPKHYDKKRAKMDKHFAEVTKADAILVVNDEKHGQAGYIGSNVLMEMAVAYYLKKPIFIFNRVSEEAGSYEEVMGMGCIQLGGKIAALDL